MRENQEMKTSKEIRHQNLLKLVEENKSQSALAAKIKKSEQQVNSWVKGKGIGDALARDIEKAFGKPTGWFDNQHNESGVADTRAEYQSNNIVTISRIDAQGSMGFGALVPDYEDVIDHVSVNKRWLSENFTISAPGNLKLATGYGDSMSPTISDGDIILIDTGVAEIKMDAVFVLERDGELFIKRIQRMLDGSFLVISDNRQAYDPYPMTNKDFSNIRVCGRALLVWNGRKL